MFHAYKNVTNAEQVYVIKLCRKGSDKVKK